MKFLFVGIGGSIGSLLRYVLYLGTIKLYDENPPFLGTLVANLVGAFVLGWFTSKLLLTWKLPEHIALGIGTGMIGSFTTFSTLSLELTLLLQDGEYLLAVIYISFSATGGFILAYLGYKMGKGQVKAQ